MNIVYLHAHDAGRYVEPYGHPVSTPNLMRFAREGVLFRKAFSAAPTCGPSRSAMLSGCTPHEVGMFGLPNIRGWAFHDYGIHLVNQLKAEGFVTVLAGCQHEIQKSEASLHELGYDRILSADREHKGEFYPDTIDRVEAFLAEEHGAPFFLSVGLDEPHRNNRARPEQGIDNKSLLFTKTRFYDVEQLDYRYTAPPPFLPDLPEIRKDMESFRVGVHIMDEYMGRVLFALEQRGLVEDTLVIVTTDHGIEFPGGKMTLSDQGTGVMLMMRGPHGFDGGRVVEPMVSQLDLYPTLCDCLGIERKPWLRGKSLLPLVNGQVEALHDYLFAEQTWHGRLDPLRSIRTERCKLVLRHFDQPLSRQDGPSTKPMVEAGYFDRNCAREELYDLYLDPWEHHNCASDPAYGEILKRLRERLVREMTETNDCFVRGEFPEYGPRASQLPQG